jgi:hypothetical protein
MGKGNNNQILIIFRMNPQILRKKKALLLVEIFG